MHLLRSTFLFKSVPPAALAPIFRDMRGKQQDKWRGEKKIALSFLSYFPFSRQMNIFLFHPSSFFSFPRVWGRIAFFLSFFYRRCSFSLFTVPFSFRGGEGSGKWKKRISDSCSFPYRIVYYYWVFRGTYPRTRAEKGSVCITTCTKWTPR